MRPVLVALGAVLAAACSSDDGYGFEPLGGYERLSQAGMYADISTKEIAPDLVEFSVDSVLWSDGAEKRRWIRLPKGERIDTSDMDHWELPVGTQVFKEFRRDGVMVETRLIERVENTGDRVDDFWMGAFLWEEDESDAIFVEDGAQNVRGTEHDVPTQDNCWQCHRGQPGGVLGIGAVQLSHDVAGLANLSEFKASKMLSDPPDQDVFLPPGDAVTSRALGYMNANCGHCHNPLGIARIDTDMFLQLSVDEATPEDTQIYQTTVQVPLQYWTETQTEFEFRVNPGDPDTSGVIGRMRERDMFTAMPPLATELVHEEGIGIVSDWILQL